MSVPTSRWAFELNIIDELLDEMGEPWLKVERAIWPDGPAHGHGSGEYAGLKAEIIATLRRLRVFSDGEITVHADHALRSPVKDCPLCDFNIAEDARIEATVPTTWRTN